MMVNPAARPMVNQSAARPSKSPLRLRRPRVLIVGCGDVGQRCLATLRTRFRVFAVTSRLEGCAPLREAGAVPIVANLDDPASLRRLRGLSARVLHLAPPPAAGNDDPRTAALLHVLAQPAPVSPATKPRILPERARRPRGLTGRLKTPLQARAFVYASTSGVYGDAGGAWVDESRPVKPTTARAQRRVAAERRVRWFGAGGGWRTSILRIPGIYAADRLPVARLERGTPALRAEDDVYTNHIHADDLARALIAALWRARPQRVYNASDDTVLKMGDYFDLAADLYGLPRPPRVARETAQEQLPLVLLSFMGESRRLENGRLKGELRLRLRHPTVESGLRA